MLLADFWNVLEQIVYYIVCVCVCSHALRQTCTVTSVASKLNTNQKTTNGRKKKEKVSAGEKSPFFNLEQKTTGTTSPPGVSAAPACSGQLVVILDSHWYCNS